MKKFLLIALTIIMALTFAACGGGANAGKSIMEVCADNEDYQELEKEINGDALVVCDVVYDQGFGNNTKRVTDKGEVAEIYKLLGQVTVKSDTDESATDSFSYVVFTLEDQTEVGFYFESDIWLRTADERYKVENTGDLWKKLKKLYE